MSTFPHYVGPNPWLAYFDAHPGADVPQPEVCWEWFQRVHPQHAAAMLREMNFRFGRKPGPK